jgi:Glycine rich protein
MNTSIFRINRRRLVLTCTTGAVAALAIGAAVLVTGNATAADSLTASACGSGADRATQMHVTVTNDSPNALTLVSADHAGGVTHWCQQAQTTLNANSTETVTDYGSGDNHIDLVYKDSVGNTYTFLATDPWAGTNSAGGVSTNTSYSIDSSHSTGHDDWSAFTLVPGHNFFYTGAPETYTVPPGVTELNVTAVGGTGGFGYDNWDLSHLASGAVITGTLAVTPGEVLTLGVGGNGGDGASNSQVGGGWGLTDGAVSFRGGNGYIVPNPLTTVLGGGGASVILDAQNNPIVVAGGGGGDGQCVGTGGNCEGGRAGYNGSLTGESGHPLPFGGTAGGNATYQGQDTTTNSATTGGAGGGGYNGGAAGINPAYGGGAGASYDAGLQNPTVAAGVSNDNTPQTAEIILSVAS